MKENLELKGIGGWLAFFVGTSFIRTALWSVQAVAIFSNHTWSPAVQIVTFLIYASVATVTGIAAFKLYKLRPNAVRWAKICIWVAMVFGLLMLLNGTPSGAPAIIFGGLWLAYFYKSRRVANTFPRAARPYEAVTAQG